MELKKGLIVSSGNFVGSRIERVGHRVLTPATEAGEKASFEALAAEIERITGISDFLSWDELREKEELQPIFNAIGGILRPPDLQVEIWGVAPPEGQTWGDIVEKIRKEEPFSVWVAIVGHQIPRSKVREKKEESTKEPETVAEAPVEEEKEMTKARWREKEESVIVLSAQLVTFNPAKTEKGETIWVGEYKPSTAHSVWAAYSHPALKEGEGKVLTPEEAEKLREEFVAEEAPESEEEVISLAEIEREEEERKKEEEREAWESLGEYLKEHGDVSSRSLLKKVLLKKLDELLTDILWKSRKGATGFFFRKSQEGRGRRHSRG